MAGDQAERLEEITATMLDPRRTPSKALVLFGPSRSGKGTWLRLMRDMVGRRNRSAVSLHQIADNRFAAANLYQKMLNTSGDISARHVTDLSIFKTLTGDDEITAERKYGEQFTFTNRALLAFSANELPTVSESSRAYFERIFPVKFEVYIGDRVDETIEKTMRTELPGILARWVRAWQRFAARGHRYSAPTAGVFAEFERPRTGCCSGRPRSSRSSLISRAGARSPRG